MAKRKLGASEAAAQLRQHILRGGYEYGERLPAERNLAANFKVARGTIRSALDQLAQDHLVQIKPGSGTFVAHHSSTKISVVTTKSFPIELLDVRLALEPHICRLAVEKANNDDFDELEQAILAVDKSPDDPLNFQIADEAFHIKLAEASGNELMTQIVRQLIESIVVPDHVKLTNANFSPESIRNSNAEHCQILQALRNRNAESCATLMAAHLETERDRITQSSGS